MKNKLFLWGFAILIIIGGLGVSYYSSVSMEGKNSKMKVISVQPFNSGQYSSDDSFTKIGSRNIKILLKGRATITGTYTYERNESGFSGYCMSNFSSNFSSNFLGKLPYDISNEEVKNFCFRNVDFVNSKLSTTTRQVSVVIDNLELNFYPSEVMNWADLVDAKF